LIKQEKIILLVLIKVSDRLINWNAMKKMDKRREFQPGSKTSAYSAF
jgi:hypothetical protein